MNPGAENVTLAVFENVFCPFSPCHCLVAPLVEISANVWKNVHQACTSGSEFYSLLVCIMTP